MVLPVALIVDMTLNGGLQVAVLHEERLTALQVRRLFWIAQRFNVALLASMALAAPLLARFYGEPRVVAVVWLWALALAFDGVGAFPEALLKRQIRFGVLTALDVTGMILGAAAAVGAATLGWREGALALQFVVWKGMRCVGAFVATRWAPGRPVRRTGPDSTIDRLVRFGRHFSGSRAVYWLGRQADRIVVGAASGAAVLGLYDSARRWSWYPFQELFLAITDVVIASLSRARQDAVRYREYCRRGFASFLALPLPAIAFVGVESDVVVRALLGERWASAVPMVRIMCAAAFADGIARLTSWLYTAEGRTRQQFRWTVVTTTVTLAAVLAAARHGAVAVTWGFALSTAALAIPGIAYCLRGSLLSGRDFVRAVWRPTVAAIVAAAVCVALRVWLLVPATPVGELVVRGLAFGSLYTLVWITLPGGPAALREALHLIRTAASGSRFEAE
jgi:PST family polysaccharide transporter